MFGLGLIKGLAVTARNLVGSYFDKERMTTIQYPEEQRPTPENYRNFPFLVFDKDPDQLRCVACRICEKECPPQCIFIEQRRDEKGRPVKQPEIFDIDVSVCMSCSICAEVCPFDAIKMDHKFDDPTNDRFGSLLFNKARLAKSNEYYHSIRPNEAAEVDARLAAEGAKKQGKPAPQT
jgi:NADH-quinone oxidoreductase subunit I